VVWLKFTFKFEFKFKLIYKHCKKVFKKTQTSVPRVQFHVCRGDWSRKLRRCLAHADIVSAGRPVRIRAYRILDNRSVEKRKSRRHIEVLCRHSSNFSANLGVRCAWQINLLFRLTLLGCILFWIEGIADRCQNFERPWLTSPLPSWSVTNSKKQQPVKRFDPGVRQTFFKKLRFWSRSIIISSLPYRALWLVEIVHCDWLKKQAFTPGVWSSKFKWSFAVDARGSSQFVTCRMTDHRAFLSWRLRVLIDFLSLLARSRFTLPMMLEWPPCCFVCRFCREEPVGSN